MTGHDCVLLMIGANIGAGLLVCALIARHGFFKVYVLMDDLLRWIESQ